MLCNLLKNIEKRILYKRFAQWRQRPKIDINNEMSKVRNLADVLTKIYKNNIRSEKYDFLDKLETTRAERAIIKSAKRIFKAYKTKSRRLMRHFFYKWRSQTKNSEITELQNQLLKYLFISRENHTNKLNLAKYMTRWRLFTSDKRYYDNIEKLERKIAEEEERIQMAEGKKQQLEQEEIEIMKKLKTTTQMHEQMVENYEKLSKK